MARKLQRAWLLAVPGTPLGALRVLVAGTALGVLACNAAVGGGLVALAGGAGYLASQCYDRVRVKVRDAETGLHTCEADVTVSDGDSERRLRPCYNTALTEGRWQLTARREGYVTASTEVQVEDHPGDCPSLHPQRRAHPAP